MSMSTLDDILRRTRVGILERRAQVPLSQLEARCRECPPTRDFVGAVRREIGVNRRRTGAMRVIAELKKTSPSKGVIRPDFAPVELARAYARAGAHAISVLTDEPFFEGKLEHLVAVREAVELPVLRKDFHVDPYQLWEARAVGADAVLLIAATLRPAEFLRLLELSRELTLAVVAEVHTRQEVRMVLECGAEVVGINNRNLKSFDVSLETTFALIPFVPPEVVLVSESGISRPEEVERLASAGVDGILVGEGLLRHADVGEALRSLMGRS